MLGRSSIVPQLTQRELKAALQRLDIDPRGMRDRAALVDALLTLAPSTDVLLQPLSTARLTRIADQFRLGHRRSRRARIAQLAGHEADRFAEPYATWVRRLERFGRDLDRLDANTVLHIGPPAREGEIRAIEGELGVELPPDFRRALLDFSGDFRFSWYLDDDGERPEGLEDIFAGECVFGLQTLRHLNPPKLYLPVNPAAFPRSVWDGKLGMFHLMGGDHVSADLRQRGGLVYVDHEDGGFSPRPLARSFEDLMNRWTRLACVNPRHPGSVVDATGRLSARAPNAKRLIAWLRGEPVSPSAPQRTRRPAKRIAEDTWARRVTRQAPETLARWEKAPLFERVGRPVPRSAPYVRYRGPDSLEGGAWSLTHDWVSCFLAPRPLFLERVRAVPSPGVPSAPPLDDTLRRPLKRLARARAKALQLSDPLRERVCAVLAHCVTADLLIRNTPGGSPPPWAAVLKALEDGHLVVSWRGHYPQGKPVVF